MTLQSRGEFRGFAILSRGRAGSRLVTLDDDRVPEIILRGAGSYKINMNAENPLGTMQSVEHALRSLDRAAEDERDRLARAEKLLTDFENQLGKSFEREARLKELAVRQAELNKSLDLDKGEQQ